MLQKENPKDFIKQHPLIFKKYKPLQLLDSGSFSNIYLGYNITNKKYVAIKTELKNAPNSILESESFILFTLKGYGIPEVFSYGRSKNHKILIQTLLGKSLLTLYNERHNRFTLYDVCSIAIQALDRIEWVHSKNYIHRDIKPNNFLIGNDDPNVLYLIDFGLAKKYKSDKTGKHILPGVCKKIFGTVRYLSINALRGKESSRRDDIISIAYVLIIFLKGSLPWEADYFRKKSKYITMIYKREKITPEELCFGLPEQFTDFVKYSYSLKFEQSPNYNYLRSLFITLIEKKYFKYNNYIFSWVNKNDSRNLSAKSSNREYEIKLGRNLSNPRQRLFTKIKNSLHNSEILQSNEKLHKENILKIIKDSPEKSKEKNKIICPLPKKKPNKMNRNITFTNTNNNRNNSSNSNNSNYRNNSNNNIKGGMSKRLNTSGCHKNQINSLGNLNSFRLNTTTNNTKKIIMLNGHNVNSSNSGNFRPKLKSGMNTVNEAKIMKGKNLIFEKLKTIKKINKSSYFDQSNSSVKMLKKNTHNNLNHTTRNTQNNTINNNIIIPYYTGKFKTNNINNNILQNIRLNIEPYHHKKTSLFIPNHKFCQTPKTNVIIDFSKMNC